jgi:hypothetical protein
MRNGHIASVKLLPGLSDQQAIDESYKLFSETPDGEYEGFELWDMARMVVQHARAEEPISSPREISSASNHGGESS